MNNYHYPYYDEEDDHRQFGNMPFLPGFPMSPGQGGPGNPNFGGPGLGMPSGSPPNFGSPGGQIPGIPSVQGSQSGGPTSGPPTSPPPAFTPQQQQVQTFAMDPGAIRGCLFRFTYVWLARDAFWFFPVFVGRRSIAGYRWAGFRWSYVGIDLNHIQSFQCF